MARQAFAYLLESTGGTGSGSAEDMDMMQVARSAGRVGYLAVQLVLVVASEFVVLMAMTRVTRTRGDGLGSIR